MINLTGSRIVSTVLIIIMITAALTGCRKDDSGLNTGYGSETRHSQDPYNGSTVPENIVMAGDFMYLPEFIPLPVTSEYEVESIVVSGDKVFFSAINQYAQVSMSIGNLYSMDFDGSNLTELSGYSAKKPSQNIAGGHISKLSLYVDHDGFLWVIESGIFFERIQFPDDYDTDEDGISNFDANYIRSSYLRKLDGTGKEVFSVDISGIADGTYASNTTICIDRDGNIYINILGDLHVLDPLGRPLFKLELQGWNSKIIRLHDGTMAGFGWHDLKPVLMHIDTENKSWGEVISLPPIHIRNVFPGNDEHLILFNDGTSLYGICSETNEQQFFFNWVDGGFITEGVDNITFLNNGDVFATRQMRSLNTLSAYPITELVILRRTPHNELPEKTVLTLATFEFEGDVRNTGVLNAVLLFNRTSTTHRIHVIDYSVYNTTDDNRAGLARLNTEIISGRIPDIIDLTSIPFEIYAARGLLEDLNPFLDADPELLRSDLMDNVIRASEINGALYRVFPTFRISTILGNPAIVGSYPGWDINEFKAVLKANPQADVPLGTLFTREWFLQLMFQHNIERFIDRESGTADFNNSYFIEILELANLFPSEQDTEDNYDGLLWSFESHLEQIENTASKRQIMAGRHFGYAGGFADIRTGLGGDAVFKGFPTDSKDGNRISIIGGIAITVGCKDKQGAWDLVRMLLKEDFQREYIMRGYFSVNRAILTKSISDAMDPANMHGMYLREHDIVYRPDELSQEEADMVMAFIESINSALEYDESLWNIISESASDYFNGQRSAQDAARIIQSRASRYLSEMS